MLLFFKNYLKTINFEIIKDSAPNNWNNCPITGFKNICISVTPSQPIINGTTRTVKYWGVLLCNTCNTSNILFTLLQEIK